MSNFKSGKNTLISKFSNKKSNVVNLSDLKVKEEQNDFREQNIIKKYEGFDDVELELNGVVSYVATSGGKVYFRAKMKEFDNDEILCMYFEDYQIAVNDRIFVTGMFKIETFEAQKQQCFNCYEVSAFYIFDLNVFLNERFPNFSSKKISSISQKFIDHAETFYEGNGTVAVVNCLDNLSKELTKISTEIEDFCNDVFTPFDLKKVRQMLEYYNNNCLKRPLKLLGITENEIEKIAEAVYLSDAFKIAISNPYRLPQIDENTCRIICRNILRMDKIPQDWIECGQIARQVYRYLKEFNWTSVPFSKMKSMFPTNFEKFKDEICTNYCCSEYLECIYYSPILKKENNVATFISKLIKGKKNSTPTPFYPGELPSDEQDAVIKSCLTERISFLSGAAGTGKTFCQGEIAREILAQGYMPMFMSFTGAAVQQIKKPLRKAQILDDCEVVTIHMGCSQSTIYKEKNIKYFIFDECSMISMSLFNWFIESFYYVSDITIIFVGDINQLPPISYGNIMRQLLKTSVQINYLTKNFRSEKGIVSLLDQVVDKDRISNQENIDWNKVSNEEINFYSGEQETANSYINFLLETLEEKIEEEFGEEEIEEEIINNRFISIRDEIMFVCPYKKVVDTTNKVFQDIFMDSFEFIVIDNKRFYIYDRVMNLVNNYSVGIMNGEIGIITEIYSEYVIVKFRDECPVFCPFFSKRSLFKIKNVKKLCADYSLYEKDESGVTHKKDSETIEEELRERYKKIKDSLSPMSEIAEEDIDLFFNLALKYPNALFGMKGEHIDLVKISSIELAYALTTYKAQGNQFDHTVYLSFKPFKKFVSRRHLYTGLSRARNYLTIIASDSNILNSSLLTEDSFVNDNLYLSIDEKLPEEFKVSKQNIEETKVSIEDFSDIQYCEVDDDDDFIDDELDIDIR